MPWTARLLTFMAGLLIVRVVVEVVAGYRLYFPPDFSTGFLHGRRSYFPGPYQWAFYAHILSGPLSLLLGLVLVSERLRSRVPAVHRSIGRVQVGVVLLLVVPSGLLMARRAEAGPVASIGLAALAVATGASAILGTIAARNLQFARHRRWMWRCYLLLCSAVVLRLLGGLGTVLAVPWPWYDPSISWLSWTVPLAAFELLERCVNHHPVQSPRTAPDPSGLP
jgi:uncharacterized membrane protein